MVDFSPLTPWYWHSFPLEERTGSQVFEQYFAHEAIAVLLESPYPTPTPTDYPYLCRYSLCAGKPRKIKGKNQLWTPELGNIFSCLEKLQQRYSGNIDNQINNNIPKDLPFQGGYFGWLGYDAAWEIEQLPYLKKETLPFPVAYWYEPENFAILDHQTQTLWLATTSPHLPLPSPLLPLLPSPALPL
ncbi:MAG: aminodeoxychorismate synthase component I, partial [Microcystaceae cyanobacterium]